MNADYYHYMRRAGHCLTTIDDVYHQNDLYPHMEWNIKQAMVFLWEE